MTTLLAPIATNTASPPSHQDTAIATACASVHGDTPPAAADTPHDRGGGDISRNAPPTRDTDTRPAPCDMHLRQEQEQQSPYFVTP